MRHSDRQLAMAQLKRAEKIDEKARYQKEKACEFLTLYGLDQYRYRMVCERWIKGTQTALVNLRMDLREV